MAYTLRPRPIMGHIEDAAQNLNTILTENSGTLILESGEELVLE